MKLVKEHLKVLQENLSFKNVPRNLENVCENKKLAWNINTKKKDQGSRVSLAIKKSNFGITGKYPLRGYILGVLTRTIA